MKQRGAAAQLASMPGLRELLEEMALWPDFDAELARCQPPRFVSPAPSREMRRRHGAWFSPDEVGRFLSFCRKLRHTKGSRWAGRPFVPDLWQVLYVIAPVFGWRRRDGNRLYTELWLEVARKAGKSTLCAALLLYLLTADSNLTAGRLAEPGAEVYSAASTARQAKEVFRPAEQMARRSPALRSRLAIRTDEALIYERTASRYEVLSGVASKAEEKMGLNPSGYVVDEVHVHKSRDLIETIESAVGAREQPLGVLITTAGLDVDGTVYAEKHAYAEAVATGDVKDARTWVAIWSIAPDDVERWDQPDVWRKANPGLGVSPTIDYLEDAAQKARESEPKRLAFLRLHLNHRTSSVSRWLPIEPWDRSGAFLVPDGLPEPGRVAYAGLDLARSIDMAAITLVLPRYDRDPEDADRQVEVLDVVVRAWTPAGRLRDRPPRDRALLEDWIRRGFVSVSPGEVIDYDHIEQELFRIADELDLQRLHFDRWGSKQLVGHLMDGGLNVFEMGQGYASFSPAMKEAERLVYERRLRHGGSPLLRHAIQVLAVQQDAAGNVKPDRDRSTGFVDSWVALVMAVDAWSRAGGLQVSVYEERGLEVV